MTSTLFSASQPIIIYYACTAGPYDIHGDPHSRFWTESFSNFRFHDTHVVFSTPQPMLQICTAFTAISTRDISSDTFFLLNFSSTLFFNFSRQYHYLPRGPYDHLNSRPVVEGFPTLYFHNAGAFSGICRYVVIQRACTAGIYGLDDYSSSES